MDRPSVQRDEDVLSTAVNRLQSSVYAPLRQLDCEILDGVLRLSGNVPSYYLKQMAQEILRNLQSVRRIENRLSVHYPLGEQKRLRGEP